MSNKSVLYSIQVILIFVVFATAKDYYTHDDVFIAVGDQIELLSSNGTYSKVQLTSYNASELVALAYDPMTNKIFFSDKRNSKGHIFSTGLGENESSPVQDIVEKNSKELVEGLTYDPEYKMLFWTDGLKQSILRLRVDDGDIHIEESAAVEVLHFLQGDRPRAIVSDSCRRMLYWTNWNLNRPTIECSHLDGSNRVIVHRNLTMPHGLGLDVEEQKIYWADNLRSGSLRIESSFVNGSQRQTIYEGRGHEMKGQFVYGLTVGKDYIYWSDWDSKALWALRKDGSQKEPTALRRYAHKPMAVIIFQHHPATCPNLSTIAETQYTTASFANQDVEQVLEATEETESLCSGYCQNDGQCLYIDSELSCKCSEYFSGERCEVSLNTSSDSCLSVESPNNEMFIAVVTLSATCVCLVLTVIFLTHRVHQLSKRPRLKRRRLTANKLDLQPQHNGPVINIEDCCNMNICETPCTEPPNRTPASDKRGGASDRVKLLNCQF